MSILYSLQHGSALVATVHKKLRVYAALWHLRSTQAQGTTSLDIMCRSTDTSPLMKWIGSWQLAAQHSLRNDLALEQGATSQGQMCCIMGAGQIP